MKLEVPTSKKLTQKGKEVLCKELGVTNTIRFLQGYAKGEGNYTKDRKATFENAGLKEITESIKSERS